MISFSRDDNRIAVIGGVSSSDYKTPVAIAVDPTTHRAKVDLGGGGTATAITVANEATDTSCFPCFFTDATGDLEPKTNAGLTFNSNTGVLTATGFSGPLTGNVTGNVSGSSGSCTGNAGTATKLAASKNIQGIAFDGSANIDIINGTGFVKATGTTLSYDNNTYYKSGDSPSFATITTTGNIELGNASDTTLARVSAGVVSIEGNNVLTSVTGLPLSGGTMTGSITLGENTSIALDPAGSADGKWSGISVTGIAGYSQAFGDLVYLDPTDSRWEAVDANAAAGADGDARGILGMVVSAGTDGNACTILLHGIIRADAKFDTFTINNPIYVSETAGAVTQTQPTTTDVVIRIVGSALTANEMYFSPDRTWITHV